MEYRRLVRRAAAENAGHGSGHRHDPRRRRTHRATTRSPAAIAVAAVGTGIVDTPLVIGALKPVILLPAALITELPADQLEALLAHELAHVLRQDYLINLLQSVVETLLFYHPAVWWISSQVRKERENCCDDLAVNVAQDRTVYVRALATVAGAGASRMVPAATGGLLVARLRRILGITDRQGAQSSRWLTGSAFFLSLCVFAIAFTSLGSRSATAETKSPEPAAKKNSPEKTQDSAKAAKPKASAGAGPHDRSSRVPDKGEHANPRQRHGRPSPVPHGNSRLGVDRPKEIPHHSTVHL